MTTFAPPYEERFGADLADLLRRVATLENQGAAAAIAGAPPTGAAGGDLAGTYPNPSVAAVNGVAVPGAPSVGQVLTATSGSTAAWSAPQGAVVAAYSFTGLLGVVAGDYRWYNDTGRTLTFGTVRASVGTAPTGSAAIVDILANGSTIFSTTAHRPSVAAGTNTATNSAAPDTTTLTNGSYLTVSIAQVGSTFAGSDLTVTVVMT